MAASRKKKPKAAAEDVSPPSCGLYAISPAKILDIGAFADTLQATLATGDVAVFQLRLKEADEASIRAATARLMPLCHAANVPFILNDLPHVVADLGCDGVHLGQEDLQAMPLRKARSIVGPDAVIGVSAHASIHLAMEAGEAEADYVAFGAFFPTRSKPQEKIERWGMPADDLIAQWSTYSTLPCVAIGGMTPQNCGALVAQGADFIAAINAIWEHPEGAPAAVRAFRASMDASLKQL